ncbi:MAG: DNA mismatch repair protein MutS, partial [Sphingobacteriia bacterium]
MAKQAETPLMKQYNGVKAQYPGTLLLFRMGDFYETFGEDAITASRLLGITLTRRNNGAAGDIELAGFPHHALDSYIPKLVRAGQRVAICEQLEDPKLAKGLVKRGVTEILTPGINLHENLLDHKANNYLAAVYFPAEQQAAAAFLDISTGDFFCLSGDRARIEKLLYSLRPSEVVLPRAGMRTFQQLYGDDFYTYRLEDWVFEPEYALKQLLEHFQVQSVKGFGLEDEQPGTTAAGVLLHYLKQMEQKQLGHLTHVYAFRDEGYTAIDKYSLRNLELLQPLFADGHSLCETIDHTRTAMGGRMLKRWIAFPLRDPKQIHARQRQVQALVEDRATREALAQLLGPIADLERLISKLATRRLNPREATSLRDSLARLPLLRQAVAHLPAFGPWCSLEDPSTALGLLQAQLADECPAQLNQGMVIRTGVSGELDEHRALSQDVKQLLEGICRREAEATGISSLKISYNRVFGYYLEVTHAHRNKVPENWMRKQTLTGAERYITPELKTLEEKILGAEDRIALLEYQLYEQLLSHLQPHIPLLQQWATRIAEADVLASLAELAVKRNYCLPVVDSSGTLDIQEGRHPVIEVLLPADQPYVPNSVHLDPTTHQILIITGPNMAGKSALLRQTALIVLLAQMGSYVPAQAAHIGV